METLKTFFRISNIGTFAFFALNLFLILALFTGGFCFLQGVPFIVAGYFITVFAALSPAGEWFLAFMAGAKEMKRLDWKIRMVPLLEVVYSKAKKHTPQMVDSIALKIVYDPAPNAFAIGRRTICVTEGLFVLSDEEIMGVLAHEVGHLANRHCEVQLVIGGANVLISGFLMLLKIIAGGIAAMSGYAAVKSRNFIKGILLFLPGALFSGAIWLWIKLCRFFLHFSMRANEITADTYACEIGFGRELAYALCRLQGNERPRNGFLRAVDVTHPDFNERIANLQNRGVAYY